MKWKWDLSLDIRYFLIQNRKWLALKEMNYKGMGDRKSHLATEDCCLEKVVKQEVLEVGVLVKCLFDVAKEYTAKPERDW